jgi:hypothetical protein
LVDDALRNPRLVIDSNLARKIKALQTLARKLERAKVTHEPRDIS